MELVQSAYRARTQAEREALKKTILRKNSKEAKQFLQLLKEGYYKIIEETAFSDGPPSGHKKELTYEEFLYQVWNDNTKHAGSKVFELRLSTSGVYSIYCRYSYLDINVQLTPKGRRIKIIKAL